MALGVLYVGATFAQVFLASTSTYEVRGDDGSQRAAVVLGAAQYNGAPSPVLRARLETAAELYQSGDVQIVVLTGGRQEADRTTEAKTGYDYLKDEIGIPDENLRLEVQGSSTYESLAATARFLKTDEVVEVVLVTDPYHAKRSQLVAEEVGLTPQVSLTDQSPSLARLARETAAVAVGRIIGFRRLNLL